MSINHLLGLLLAPAIGAVLAYDSGGYFAGLYDPAWLGYVVAGLFPAAIVVLGQRAWVPTPAAERPRWGSHGQPIPPKTIPAGFRPRWGAWVLIIGLFGVESFAAGLHLARPVAAQNAGRGHLALLESLADQAGAEAVAFAAQGQKINLARRSEELAALRSQIAHTSSAQATAPQRGQMDLVLIIASRLVLGVVLIYFATATAKPRPALAEPQTQPMEQPTANPGELPPGYRPLPPRGPNGKFVSGTKPKEPHE